MARQKCVMGAMLSQLSPRTVLTQFQDIAEAGKQIVTTDIPAAELNTFLQLANKARRLPVSTVSFVPPKIETYDPDYDRIEEMVETAIERAEAADERPRGRPAPGRARGEDAAAAVPAGDPGTADPYDANETAALTGSC
jgi:polyisoprenyl-teichoic acid--peptidoglycan teichoic acid transferase